MREGSGECYTQLAHSTAFSHIHNLSYSTEQGSRGRTRSGQGHSQDKVWTGTEQGHREVKSRVICSILNEDTGI